MANTCVFAGISLAYKTPHASLKMLNKWLGFYGIIRTHDISAISCMKYFIVY